MTDLKILAAGTILAVLTLGSISAAAQSFNCRYARLPAEVAICQDPGLRAMDRQVAKMYFEWGGGQVYQRDWLRNRNRCGYNSACLRKIYESRIWELDGNGMDAD
jgi:uncharacterized protein